MRPKNALCPDIRCCCKINIPHTQILVSFSSTLIDSQGNNILNISSKISLSFNSDFCSIFIHIWIFSMLKSKMPTLFLACEQKLMPCKMAEESISKFQNFLFLQLNFHILDFWWPWNQYLSFRTFLIFFVSIKFSYLCKSSMKYKALKTFESNLDLQQSLLTKKKIFGKNWKICC